MSTSIEQIGRRHYLRGLPFALKDAAKAAGCKWDPDERAWWSASAEVAQRVMQGQSSEAPKTEQAQAQRKAPGDDLKAGRIDTCSFCGSPSCDGARGGHCEED